MNKFTNLHLHTNYSWDCISNPKDVVDFVKNNGQKAVAITDHGNMNGVMHFFQECKKKEIKPIIGNEFYITMDKKCSLEKNADNRSLKHLVVLAKNEIGYKNLLQLTSLSNHPDRFYYKPRIDKKLLAIHSEGLIVLNGHIGTSLSEIFFKEEGITELCDNIEEVREYLHADYKEKFKAEAEWFHNIWGDDFYVEIQLFDKVDLFQQSLGHFLMELAEENGYQACATGDAHYITPADQPYHKTFVCIMQNTKFNKARPSRYMDSGMYGIVTNEQANECYPEYLLKNTDSIVEKIESYEITKPQTIPNFPVKDKVKEVKNLCIAQLGVKCPDTEEYEDRLQYELSVLRKGDLEGYFLIVKDYIEWAESQGIMVGVARGSSLGSLVSYLLGITKADPIPYDLRFERFYSEDRAEAGQLPDIDTDFQASRRDEVIQNIKDKYGHDKVCGLVTFGTLQGRGALKDVFRVHNAADFTTINKITECIPGKDKVSDKLAEFKNETGYDSLLLYCLITDPESLKDYCTFDTETKTFHGEYAEYFKLAVGLEGAIKSDSKHPCAIIISDTPITESAPLVRDKNNDDLICGYDGPDGFEAAGLVKFDILGITSLDKLQEVNKIIREIGITV